jgi:hypothetical protein
MEALPIVLGLTLGALIWCKTQRQRRMILSICAVGASGATATVLSGEYAESWMYILLDFGQAAFGLAIGFVIGHIVLHLTGTTSASLLKS